ALFQRQSLNPISQSPFNQLLHSLQETLNPQPKLDCSRRIMPRYLLLLHGDQDSEDGKMPSKEILEQMHAFNAEIMSAGALLGGEGLHATSKGARVSFSPPDPANPNKPGRKSDIAVTNGPFGYTMKNPDGQCGESKRPVCGFWILKAKDLEEAVAWVKKGPLAGTYVEVREIFESCDIPDMTKEMREEEEGWRKELEGKK
ncbi:MAG: hypothetical protein Q9164_004735, partial [Protoblastenia rupestris]